MRRAHTLASLLAFTALACSTPPTSEEDAGESGRDASDTPDAEVTPPVRVRLATYNVSMFRTSEGQLATELAGGEDTHARQVAEVLQRVRPDIVLLNEFDRDPAGDPAALFVSAYLEVAQAGLEPLSYPHVYVAETNTGEPTGVDLNNDGASDGSVGSQAYGDDSFGFGRYPGQYGMVVLSRFPIDAAAARTMRKLKWKDMPGNLQPADFYSAAAIDVMRLSSKNHIDVPVDVDGQTIHVLASHPTPPSFDGDEDRNGRRNHDEIRLWVDYLSGDDASGYITDDQGASGGLELSELFFVAGDLNSDPADGDSRREALADLLAHPRVLNTEPSSEGGAAKSAADGRANTAHAGDASLDTADFNDNSVGNLRVDYLLPSSRMTALDSGVFWPAPGEDGADAASVSDHHLVWVDVELP